MGDKTKNFNFDEFACHNCPCGGENKIKNALIRLVQKIRDEVGKPVYIESGYRCKLKNSRLSNAVPNSGHLTGEAADVFCKEINNYALGAIIKKMYKEKKIPELQYCYLPVPGGRTVHVGIDKKNRKTVFGF